MDNDRLSIKSEKIDFIPVLPRSAWSNQLAYLRVVFRAKQALDRIEQMMDSNIKESE